jgi:deoxyribonuclease-4
MVDELERCERLGVAGLIFHPGSHLDDAGRSGAHQHWRITRAERDGIKRIAKSLDKVNADCHGCRAKVLLETTAGQGTAIGYRFEHLRGILDQVREPDRLGVCLDTCHLFAAGYDFRTKAGYDAMLDELDHIVGVSRVRCIHTNDSKRECGSRVDHHEHIGKGKIGKLGFAHFVNDARFHDVPFILETPKGVDGRGTDLDKVNLKRLSALVGSGPLA